MSLRRTALFACAVALALPALSTRLAAQERSGKVREEVAVRIVRLLPPQPKPARDAGGRLGAKRPARIAIWVDRSPAWIGEEHRLADGLHEATRLALSSASAQPGSSPFRGARPEICVGTVLRGGFDEAELVIAELDCARIPVG